MFRNLHRSNVVAGCGLLLAIAAFTRGASDAPFVFDSKVITRDSIITHANDRVELVSKVYHIDKLYRSMTGPWSQVQVTMVDSKQPEIVWITGARVEMLDAAGRKRMPDEFMCHVNVDIDGEAQNEQFGFSKPLDGRLFTLSQGQLTVKFPKGTGIPVRSDQPLDVTTQVLNLNQKDANFETRHHVTIDIVRDRDVVGTMTPLYETAISGQVSLEGREVAFDIQDHGTGSQLMGMCIPGQKAIDDWQETEDRYGHKFSSHWIVKPGREYNRTRCTSVMNLQFDTKLHAIAVHMHPYAESLEFRDVSENKTIFKSEARNFKDKIGLAHMESFESPAGVPLYKGHEYELVSVYNNTSKEDVDSMAVMYLYLADPEFDRAKAERRFGLVEVPEPPTVSGISGTSGPSM